MGLSLQFENHHPRGDEGELGLGHKGNLIVDLFLGGHSELLTSAWGTSHSLWTSPFHQISNQCFCQGAASLASADHPGMSPNRNNVPLFSESSFGSPQRRPELGVRVGRAIRKEEEEGWVWIFKGQLEYG